MTKTPKLAAEGRRYGCRLASLRSSVEKKIRSKQCRLEGIKVFFKIELVRGISWPRVAIVTGDREIEVLA